MMECKECDGTGYVDVLDIKAGPDGPYEIMTDETCEICDGEGQVEEDIEEESDNE